MKINYTVLSGKTFEVSEDFKTVGMSILWQAMINAKKDGSPLAEKILEEAHAIMSAVLYGEIKKEA